MENNGISSGSAPTGQWKKLIFTRYHSDKYGAAWKVSTWKVAMWMIAIIALLILVFSFFQENQEVFLKDMLFYSIITMILILAIWLIASFILKSRKLFYRFLIGWILILGVYMGLGFLCQVTGLFPNGFHFGLSTWTVISFLAFGAKNVGDGNIDRKDVFFCLLVIIIFFIANVPIFSENMGFLEQMDFLIAWVSDKLSFINMQQFIAN